MSNVKWTKEMDAKVIEMAKAGKKDKAIAAEIGCSKAAAATRRCILGHKKEEQRECLKSAIRGPRKRVRTNKPYSTEELGLLKRAWNKGKGFVRLAKKLRRNLAGVRSTAYRLFSSSQKKETNSLKVETVPRVKVGETTKISPNPIIVETDKKNFAFVYAEALKLPVMPTIRIRD